MYSLKRGSNSCPDRMLGYSLRARSHSWCFEKTFIKLQSYNRSLILSHISFIFVLLYRACLTAALNSELHSIALELNGCHVFTKLTVVIDLDYGCRPITMACNALVLHYNTIVETPLPYHLLGASLLQVFPLVIIWFVYVTFCLI